MFRLVFAIKLFIALFVIVLIGLALVVRPSNSQPTGDGDAGRPSVTIGSKKFTESVILGEMLRQLSENAGARVRHRRELGGTRIVWEALKAGDIDAYVEYTGTLRGEIFAGETFSGQDALRERLNTAGIRMTAPLGFNNTYAIAVKPETAERYGLEGISDLSGHPDLSLGFSNEFMDRADGWPGLKNAYGLGTLDARGMDHDLAYRGVASGDVDVTDTYSTDAEISYYDLRLLKDDREYFPTYHAVILYRADLEERAPRVMTAFHKLTGRINEKTMAALNKRVKIDRQPEGAVAAGFLSSTLDVDVNTRGETWRDRLWRNTLDHLVLVAISLGAAVLLALPLGLWAARRPRTGQVILGVVGIIQTIPSLALFVFMIPLLGIGGPPAVVALFLYSLLPIVRNTQAGLTGISGGIRESAEALGLPPAARLRLVDLPLALPTVLAGIKTSAVINVGTATLAALIGAGGYGQPILTGIRLDDTGLILEGAVPAAVLAIAAQVLFELFERAVVPRGLRLKHTD